MVLIDSKKVQRAEIFVANFVIKCSRDVTHYNVMFRCAAPFEILATCFYKYYAALPLQNPGIVKCTGGRLKKYFFMSLIA